MPLRQEIKIGQQILSGVNKIHLKEDIWSTLDTLMTLWMYVMEKIYFIIYSLCTYYKIKYILFFFSVQQLSYISVSLACKGQYSHRKCQIINGKNWEPGLPV